MNSFDDLIPINYLNELRNVCSYQLNRYPEISRLSIKQRMKLVLKIVLRRNNKIDRFFWPNGLLAIALEQSFRQTNEQKDLNCLIEYYDKWIENGLAIHNLDNVINGYSLIYVYEKTGKEKYKKALDSIADYVINHPKDMNNCLPYRLKPSETNLAGNIYIDGLGMICPFLARYGKLTNNDDLINLSIIQLENFVKYGFDVKTNLPYHAYNADRKLKLGIIGWGRAVGWVLIGLIDSLEYIDPSHEKYNFLRESFMSIVDRAIDYQHNDGYFSWQLEAIEGPIDTSATAMISYAIGKGIKIGVLKDSYESLIKKSIIALYNSTNNGYVENCSAECHGLSMYPQKYGWYPWSQGPTTALISMFY